MRKIFILAIVTFFIAPFVFAQDIKQPLAVAPKVISIIGHGSDSYEPTRWPDFYDFSSDNPTCGAWLRDELSLTRRPGFDGTQYRDLAGLEYTFRFSEQGLSHLRKAARILVAWTVRIEGEKQLVNPWPSLCRPWHGTSYQRFPAGDVYTRLYVNGEYKPKFARMTIPSAGKGVVVNPCDPTHTGSVVLTLDDFDGEFPEELLIEIRWYNDTCMQVTTPDKMRNLIITVTPI